MAKTTVQPPKPPDVKGAREVEKVAQAHALAQSAQSDGYDQGSDETAVEEIRGLLHDALESLATALQRLDDLESRVG